MSGGNAPIKIRPHQTALLAAGVASLVVWAIPFVQQLLLPLIYLNTHVHELLHALAAMAIGGQVHSIHVFATGGGVTPVSTPPGSLSILVVASAGYVGAALVGAAIIMLSHNADRARSVLYTFSAILALSVLLWVRGDAVGVATGILWVIGLWAMARYLDPSARLFAAQFLGLQQCLNAFQSLYMLFHISAFTGGQSDALIMEQTSGIPAVVWAIGWGVFSLAMVGWAFHRAWHRAGSPARRR